MSDINERFLKVAREVYRRNKAGGKSGPRKSGRLQAFHGWVQDELRTRLGYGYEIQGLSDVPGSKEVVVDGLYYKKKVDISVSYMGHILGVVSCKFIQSNYGQNSNNYFEQQMGEISNLRSNDLVYGSIFCLPEPIPYKNRAGDITRVEHIRNDDIRRYYELERDHNHTHTPNIQAVVVFKTNSRGVVRICKKEDLSFLDNEAYERLMRMDLERFFRVFSASVKIKADFVGVDSGTTPRIA